MNDHERPVIPPTNVGECSLNISDTPFSPSRAKVTIMSPDGVTPLSNNELVSFIKEEGIPPSKWIVEQIKRGARIIGIGESHKNEQMELNLLDILKSVHEKSGVPIGEIAMESDTSFQGEVDAYLRGEGELSDEAIHLHTGEFRKVMEYAKQERIKVICVDDGLDDAHRARSESVDRDANMHERVNRLHQSHPDSLTIWSVGNGHLGPYHGLAPRPNRVILTDNPKFLAVQQEMVYSTGEIWNPTLIPSNKSERFQRTPQRGLTVEQTKTFRAEYYGNSDATIFMSKNPKFTLNLDKKTLADFLAQNKNTS